MGDRLGILSAVDFFVCFIYICKFKLFVLIQTRSQIVYGVSRVDWQKDRKKEKIIKKKSLQH